MATPTPDRRFSAPSGFDMGATNQFSSPSTADTGPIPVQTLDSDPTTDPIPVQSPDISMAALQDAMQTPNDDIDRLAPHDALEDTPEDAELKQIYSALDADVIAKYDQASAEMLSDALAKLPDISDDISDTIDKIASDRAKSPVATPSFHEEKLLMLGQREVVLSKEWFKLRNVEDPEEKIRAVHGLIHEEADAATGEEKDELLKKEARVGTLIAHYDIDDEIGDLREAAAGNYYSVATELSGKKLDDKQSERLKDVLDPVEKLIDYDEQEIAALDIVHAYLPRVMEAQADTDDEDEETVNEQVEAAKTRLNEARSKLAELHAKRQKKLVLFDKNSPEAIAVQNEYNAAVRAMIAKEIMAKVTADGKMTDAEANEFIATRTVDEAMNLDKETIENYGKNNTRVGKFINWMAGRKPNGEPDNSKKAKLRRFGLKYAAPVGFLVGSVLTGGAAAVAVASGAYATTKLYAHFETAGRDRRMKKQAGLLKREDVIKSLAEAEHSDKNDYDWDDEHMIPIEKQAIMVASASRLIESAAEQETFKQQLHATKRLLGAVAIGAGAAVGTRMIGHWINPDGPAVAHEGGGADGTPDVPGTPGDTPPITIAPEAPTPDIPVPGHEFAPGTFYAHNGDGFYQILKNMGVEAAQRDDVLAKASRELFRQGYAYQMSDGLPGIPRPGTLPQGAIDILVKAAGK